jgi:hypothetical protein
MATWKAIRTPRPDKDLEIQDRIELSFKNEWLHLNIFGSDNATIRWLSSHLCTSPFLIMIEGVVASLPARGSPPHGNEHMITHDAVCDTFAAITHGTRTTICTFFNHIQFLSLTSQHCVHQK